MSTRPPKPPRPAQLGAQGLPQNAHPDSGLVSPATDGMNITTATSGGTTDDPLSPGFASPASPAGTGLSEGKKDKKTKKDKAEKKAKKDKKDKKRDKKSKKSDAVNSSDDDGDDDFQLEDEAQMIGELKRDNTGISVTREESAASPAGLNRQESTMAAALRRMASKIQQQSTIVSVLHGPQGAGAGPQQGSLIKILNRSAGFMFLSTSIGRPHDHLGTSVQDDSGDQPHDDSEDGVDAMAPFPSFMSSAAIPPADDPDTQRFLVQSLTIPGHSGSYIAFAAKSPLQPTVFLGAAPPAQPTNPFAQPSQQSRPGSATVAPDVYFSAPFNPERHCWKVIPSEGTWFFLQPAAQPGFVIECPPPALNKAGVSKPLLLRLAAFSGAPTQCFRSSTSRGVGSSMDSGSIGRFEETEELGSGISGSFAPPSQGSNHNHRPLSGGLVSNGSRDPLSPGLHGNDGGLSFLSAADQLDQMLFDDMAVRVQTWARGCLTRKAVRHVTRVLEDVAVKRAEHERKQQLAADALVAVALSVASYKEAMRRQAHATDAAATRINSVVRGALGRRERTARVDALSINGERRAVEEAAAIAAEDLRLTVAVQRAGRGLVAARRPLALQRRALMTINAFVQAAQALRQLQGKGARTTAARRIQSAVRQSSARQERRVRAEAASAAGLQRAAKERAEAAAQEAKDAALAQAVLPLLRARSSAAEAALRRAARANRAATTLQLRLLPTVQSRRSRADLRHRQRLSEEARVVEEQAADAFQVKTDAVQVIQRRLLPLAVARNARKAASAKLQAALEARMVHEETAHAAVVIQSATRGHAVRRYLKRSSASKAEAQALLLRVFEGFVVRMAVCVANPHAMARRRYEAFPTTASVTGASSLQAGKESPGRRHRRSVFKFTEGVDSEGFVRLRQLRPSSAARKPPRRPSEWSIEATVIRRAAAAAAATTAGPAAAASPSASVASPASQSVADPMRLPAVATHATGSRPASVTYPFHVPSRPSSSVASSSPAPGAARAGLRRPTSVLLRPATGESGGGGASSRGAGDSTAPTPLVPRPPPATATARPDAAALRFLRGDAATPTAATRDLAADMCSAILKSGARGGGEATAAGMSPGGAFLPLTGRRASLPLDAIAHLLVDSPMPTPHSSFHRPPPQPQPPTSTATTGLLSSMDRVGAGASPGPATGLPMLSGSPLPPTYGDDADDEAPEAAVPDSPMSATSAAPHPPPPPAPPTAPKNRPPSGRQRKTTAASAATAAATQQQQPQHQSQQSKRIQAKLTSYHLLKFRSLRAVGPWTGAVASGAPSSSRPRSGSRQSPLQQAMGRPPADATEAVTNTTSAAPSGDDVLVRSLSPIEGSAPPPPPEFEYSMEAESIAAQPLSRPIPLSTITPMRAALERKLATHDLYRGHLELLKRMLSEHGELIRSARSA